jgi:hypothetical protein
MKRLFALTILVLVVTAAFPWPNPGGTPGRALPARALPALAHPEYGAGAGAAAPRDWTAIKIILRLFMNSLIPLLLIALIGVSVHNGVILRRILAAMPPSVQVDMPEIAEAKAELEKYLTGPGGKGG